MLIELELPFVDVRAADLALALDAPHQDAISVLQFETAEHRAELRLLGCSHQAIICAERYQLSELVACSPGQTGPLPAHATDSRAGRRYEFRASIRTLAPGEYARRAASVMAAISAHDDGLVGTFPQPDGAFTALRFTERRPAAGIKWETWHAYPQTREIVFTSSEVL